MATAGPLCDKRECPICTEVYTDPRFLPCGHTFCRQCIEAFSGRACPLCRKPFTLPRNGVGDLPKNFALVDVLEREESSNVESKTSGCEACSGGEATVYCVECQQKLCQTCKEDHKKFNVTRRHEIVELRKCSAVDQIADDSVNRSFAEMRLNTPGTDAGL